MEASQKPGDSLHDREAKMLEKIPIRVRMLQSGVDNKEESSFLDKVILFVEYMQLLSQIVFLNSRFTHASSPGLLYHSVLYILKIFNPCFVLSTERNRPLLISLFIVAIFAFAAEILLAGYVALANLTWRQGERRLMKLWKLNLKLIGRCTTFFIISFLMNVIDAHDQNNPDVNSISKGFLIGITVIIGLYQVAVSVDLWVRYPYILPNKQFLSAKDNYIEIVTLFQKIILLILQVSLGSSRPNVNTWIVVAINIAFGLARDGYFLQYLPPYKTETIRFSAVLFMSITSLNIAYLVIALSNSIDWNPNNMPFALILWALFFPVLTKNFLMKAERIMRRTIAGFFSSKEGDKTLPISLLIHKIELIRQLRKNSRANNDFNRTVELGYLKQSSINSNPGPVFGLDPESLKNQHADSIEDRASSNRLFTLYLEKLVLLNQKNESLRLYLAYYYGRKLKAYGMAVKELVILERSSSMKIRFNALLLKLEVQETIRKEYRNENNKLDLMAYHAHKDIYTRIRDDITKQTNLQIAMNQEILTSSSDLLKIFKMGQVVEKLRKSIHKRMKNSIEAFPPYYYEPYLVFGYYELALNHSIRDFVRYNKIAITNYKKFQPKYKSRRLQQENLYEVNKMLFKIDIKKDSPNIVECTNSVKAYLGWEPKFLEEKGIANVIAPPLQEYYLSGIKAYAENGDKYILNNVTRTFAFHKNHYIIPVEAYLNLHPVLTKGMFLEMLMRPVMDNKEYILVDKEGHIECFTERIGRRLKLRFKGSSEMSISSLSPELAEMNTIYNRIIHAGMVKSTRNLLESQGGTSEKRLSEAEVNKLALFKPTTAERVRKSALRHLNLKTHQNEEISDLFNLYNHDGKRMKLMPLKEDKNAANFAANEIQREKSFTPVGDGYNYVCKLDSQYYEDFQLKLFVFEETPDADFKELDSPGLKKTKTIAGNSPRESSTNTLSQEDLPQLEDPNEDDEEEDNENGTLPTRFAFQTQATSIYKTKEDKDFPLLTSPKDTEHGGLMSPKYTENGLMSPKYTENGLMSPKFTENGLMSPKDTNPEALLSPKCFSSNDALPFCHPPSQADDDEVGSMGDKEQVGVQKLDPEEKDRYISSLQFDHTESNVRGPGGKTEAMKDLNEKQENFKILIAVAESVGSQKSRTSSQERALRPFRQALNTRFRPKFYLFLIALFYSLLTLIVIDQFVVQLIFEDKIDRMKARKDILRNSEQRNNLIIKIQRNMRYIWDISQGRISTSGFLPLALPLPARVTVTQSDLGFLSDLNEDLLVNTDVLTKEDRAKLFENNVNVFDIDYDPTAGTSPPSLPPGGSPPPDSGNSVKLTGFQAIDRIVETGLKGIELYRASQPTLTFERFNFVFRNGLNDFYLKSEDISSLFLQSSQDDKENSITLFTFNLVVVMVILGGISFAVFVLVFKQYSSEKQNMMAFVKIERSGIEKVLSKLEDFKKLLYQDINYDILEKVKPQEFTRGFSRLNTKKHSHSRKEKDYNSPYYGGITWKYFFYLLQYIVIVAIIVVLIVLITLQNISQVSYYYNNLHRIFYLDKTRSNLNLAATISNELLSQNGTTFVRNESIVTQMTYQIGVLQDIIENTPETMKNRKGEYSPLIYQILFQDTCGLFNTSYQAICALAGKGWKTRSLLNMLRSTQSSMSLIFDNYNASDKSTSVINSLIAVAFNQIVIPYTVTGELGSWIEIQLNDEFDSEIENMKKKIVGIMVVIWVVGALAIGAVWFLIFRKILLADRQFKRVLKIMPPKLIFSNFLLKSYMLKTSNGALNTIRNSI